MGRCNNNAYAISGGACPEPLWVLKHQNTCKFKTFVGAQASNACSVAQASNTCSATVCSAKQNQAEYEFEEWKGLEDFNFILS